MIAQESSFKVDLCFSTSFSQHDANFFTDDRGVDNFPDALVREKLRAQNTSTYVCPEDRSGYATTRNFALLGTDKPKRLVELNYPTGQIDSSKKNRSSIYCRQKVLLVDNLTSPQKTSRRERHLLKYFPLSNDVSRANHSRPFLLVFQF